MRSASALGLIWARVRVDSSTIVNIRVAGLRLSSASTLFWALTAFLVMPVPAQAQTAIPTLLDPALQTCLDDAVEANGWTSVDEVTSLLCSDRGVVRLDGISQLSALTELDVSDNFLEDLEPLSVFSGLTKLNLSGNERLPVLAGPSAVLSIVAFNEGLTHLGLDDIPILESRFLPSIGSGGQPIELLELSLSNTGIRDVLPLTDFPTLRALDLSENPIQNFELPWLSLFPALERLDLSGTPLTNVEPLADIQTLTHLDLSGIPIDETDILQIQFVIMENDGVTHLGLADLPIRDLSSFQLYDKAFRPLPLVELDLSRSRVSDLTPLTEFPLLESLKLSGNGIGDISALLTMPNLSELDLSDNVLTDLSPLQQLDSLTRLDLSRNDSLTAESIAPILMNNRGVTHLALAGIPIQDLSALPLRGLENLPLVELDLSNTQITSDGPPVPLGLEVLRVANNRISDLDAFASDLVNMKEVDASYNELTSLSTLVVPFGSRLQRLDVSGNVDLDPQVLELAIQSSTRLTHLGLRDIPVENLPFFFPGTPSPRPMIELDLGNAQLDSSEIATLGQLPWLRVLKLDANQIDNLLELAPLERLEELRLSGNENLAVPDISAVLFQNRNWLERVGLRDIPIGMELFGLFPLIDDQGQSRLVELDLQNTGISDLFPITPQSSLELLNLADNQITDILPLFDGFHFESVSLLGNERIRCEDLDALELALGPGVLVRPLVCGRKLPPTLEIFSPIPDFIYPGGEAVLLAAIATDQDGLDLSPLIQWSSDRDGPLGVGGFLEVPLTGGPHTISASVTDSGETTVASVDIVVLNQPPIAAAVPFQLVELGGPAVLDGSASTDPDGDPLSFTWTDENGAIVGNSAVVPLTLNAVGFYGFTLTVRDPQGDSSQALSSIEVRDTVAPAVTLTAADEVAAGVSLPIEWTAADLGGIAGSNISFSSDGGLSYVPIIECSDLGANVRSCIWSAPAPPTLLGLLRVAVRDASGNVAIADKPLAVLAVETVDLRIDHGFDDAAEGPFGFTRLRGRRLRLARNVVGLRFANVAVPRDAIILSAHVEFAAFGHGATTTPIQIVGEASDDASEFARRRFDISSREDTASVVDWEPTVWTTGQVAATPDIRDVIDEVVSRPGWEEGSAMVLVFGTGSGRLHAVSFEGDSNRAAVLRIEFARRAR